MEYRITQTYKLDRISQHFKICVGRSMFFMDIFISQRIKKSKILNGLSSFLRFF